MTPGVGVVGCGPWGANLVRTFARLGALRAVVDVASERADAVATRYAVPAVDLDALLSDPAVDAVAVAVPAADHFPVALRVLAAGRHAFVEKPLALDVERAAVLCDVAEQGGLVLMVGHLLRYHPAFVALRRLVATGALGRLRHLSSRRLALGRVRRDEDVLWSFAPHDVSMVLALAGAEPDHVTAVTHNHFRAGVADVASAHLSFPGGARADVSVSWLHPVKEHRLVVVGDDAMAVLDDAEPWPSKLRVWRLVTEWDDGVPRPVAAGSEAVAVDELEPLEVECRHFLDCVADGSTPTTDGAEGVRVLRVLDAARRSAGAPAAPPPPPPARHPGVRIHESAYVDEPCEIGAGTSVWHFCHILAGSRIGRNCTLGQNVMVGPEVTIGDGCRIQNNVSIYRGVTLEDGVFCGPSAVFTNVATPRAGIDRRGELRETLVERGATIGANATIVCGHTVGAWSFVAAGATVASDVAPHALVAGVPARRVGWVSHDGERLGEDLVCPRSGRRYALTTEDRLEEVPDS